jgi:Rieske 2Fe-2S family protein
MTIAELIERRKPGHSLEQPFYTSDEILRLEFERIFSQRWLFAGPAMLIPEPGDYILARILDESIIVVRGDDGNVRAHFNVCRHRGSHICLEQTGRVKQLVCPYHAWVYGLDGKLLSARLTPDDFCKDDYGLDPVHVREEQGLLFICLADEPRDSFDKPAAAMAEVFGPYNLPNAKIAKHVRYDVKANWKLLRENFWECYHCVPNHPEYCSKVPAAQAAGLPDKQRLNTQRAEQLQEKWRQQGVPIASHYSGDDDPWWRCGSDGALEQGAVSNSLDGGPVAPVMGTLPADFTGYMGMAMPQCFTLEGSRDHVVTLRLLPTSTAVDIWWLVRGDAVEGRDYDPDTVAAMWKITAEQDWKICESS